MSGVTRWQIATTYFASHPGPSFVLALLTACIGLVFLSGWIPVSPNRLYFVGHEWIMAVLCWAMAIFFALCAWSGLRRRGR